MKMNRVEGTNKGDLTIYTLSTCIWCKKTKAFLDTLGVGYNSLRYISFLRKKKKKHWEIKRFNPQCSFPTLVVNGKRTVSSYTTR
jgi:glutaredoxin